MVNGDPKGPEEAEDQGLGWFEKHFAQVSY